MTSAAKRTNYRARVAALMALSFAIAAQAADYAGRAVSAVLDELRIRGLTFIYSSELVPADLRVASEPRARDGLELAREILAQHELSLTTVAPGVYAVVRSAERTESTPTVPANPAVLAEVVVHSSRYTLLADDSASHTFLTQDQVKSMPRLADETLRAAQRLPGVASNGFAGEGFYRGGEPNELAIVLDGLRLYEPFHLKDFLSPVSLLDSRIVAGMDVYAGGFPVTFGNRMSAVIDATTVHPVSPDDSDKQRYFEAGLSLFHLSALAASQFAEGRGEALLSARRSNAAELAQFSEHDFGKPTYSDGLLRLDYRFSDATRGALHALIANDRIDALRDGGDQRARAEYRGAYVWGTVTHDWSSDDRSRVIVSFTDITNQREGWWNEAGRFGGQVRDFRDFYVIGVQIDNTLLSSDFEQRFGGEARRVHAAYSYTSQVRYEAGFPFPNSPVFQSQYQATPQPRGYETSLYWDGRARLPGRLTAQAGLRFDQQTYDNSGDAAQWSPRLGLLYELGDSTKLRASWGRFFQPHAVNELQVEDGRDTFNPAQQAEHSILSVEHGFAGGIDLRIEAYRKEYRRVSPRYENLFDPLTLLPELEFDRVAVTPDRARAEGVETLVRLRPLGAWSGWLGYSWSRVRDRISGAYVPRSWDQRHAVTFGVVWSKGPWNATVADTYHSGWPTTELRSDGAPPNEVVTPGPRNAQRLGAYNSLDVRITRTFELSHGAIDVFFEVGNLLDRKNPCCTEYSVTQDPSGAARIDAEARYWLPLVPSAGVLWRY